MKTIKENKIKQTIDDGTLAWIVLTLYVIVWDLFALRKNKTTLSTAFYQSASSRTGKPLLIAVWSYLTAHLFRWLPKKYDPLRRLG